MPDGQLVCQRDQTFRYRPGDTAVLVGDRDALDRVLRCSGALEGPWPRARGTGPRAKTVRQHQLEGTKQKCRHDGYQNADPPMGDPPKAEGLSEMASAEWDRMCDRMRLAGTLATTDDATLLRDVRSFELVERLEAQLATEPLTFLKITVDGAGQEHQEKKANPLTVDRPETSGGAAVERGLDRGWGYSDSGPVLTGGV